jgi:hypothetical protein
MLLNKKETLRWFWFWVLEMWLHARTNPYPELGTYFLFLFLIVGTYFLTKQSVTLKYHADNFISSTAAKS